MMGQGFGSQIGRSVVAAFITTCIAAFIAGGIVFTVFIHLFRHLHFSAWWK